MKVETAWVKPPTQIGGLDHLAVQAPCISIYGRLLPGITNVTDRAQYYLFYPWIVWALEQDGYQYNDAFIDKFRRADCLFTLIAQHHAHETGSYDEHAAATIGSANLNIHIKAVREGISVRLSDFSHRDENRAKYFKNKLGGLGQYYFGVFWELNIMDGSTQAGIKNTNQVGKVLAESYDLAVDRRLFLQTLDEDLVSVERLNQLVCFCPCQIKNNQQAIKHLNDLFFVRGLFEDSNMLPRRRSLQTMLYLSDELSMKGDSINSDSFRGCVYSGALPDGSEWKLPERLLPNRGRWAVYQRNELLSVAIQGLFYVLLDTYHESGLRFGGTDELVVWFLDTPEAVSLSETFRFDDTLHQQDSSIGNWLPELENWTNENHEIQCAKRISALSKQNKSVENRTAILIAAIRILFALRNRDASKIGYGDLIFPGNYFSAYPINLKTFLSHQMKWGELTVRDWLTWLSKEWGITAHLRVALRKLRNQSRSTFRIRPSDLGMEVISVPEAVFTSPRFNQSVRILKDIGALTEKDKGWAVSDTGLRLMEISDE